MFTTTALYPHDCETCVYLGTKYGADLYYHGAEGSLRPVVIGRLSFDVDDYVTSHGLSVIEDETLVDAVNLAEARGLPMGSDRSTPDFTDEDLAPVLAAFGIPAPVESY